MKMNISQLIEMLEQIRTDKGDIRVMAKNEIGSLVDISERDMYAFRDSNVSNTNEMILAFDV